MLREAGWDACCDEVWVCVVSEAEQLRRLRARDRLSIDEARERIANQIDPIDRARQAHVILSTEGIGCIGGTEGTEGGAVGVGTTQEEGANGETLDRQLQRALEGVRARAACHLDTAAGGSPAQLWWSLCAELGVPSPAARRLWREIVEQHTAAHRHCHGTPWLARWTNAVHQQLNGAGRPTALRVACFFAYAGTRHEVKIRLLERLLQVAPRLESADALLATHLVATVDAHGGDPDDQAIDGDRRDPGGGGDRSGGGGGSDASGEEHTVDRLRFVQATQAVLYDPPAKYARHAARLLLERRCTPPAAALGSVSMVAEIRLREIGTLMQTLPVPDASETLANANASETLANANTPRVNLQAEQRRLHEAIERAA